jgi:multiple sugar transport system ATP-binding protein
MARVKLEHVKKIFGSEIIINDFNLDIEDGEFMVFVGPSGCGKSTTLRMIAGLETITGGTIKIGERIVNDLQPRDRDIAMVFQNYALYPHMDVYSNMAFSLKLAKVPPQEIDHRVKESAEILEITSLLKRKPRELSGGQSQRVALGRAIVRKPQVFLFDEPLSNLDAKLRVQMRAEISRLHHRLKTTIIYVTHDQTEAMTLGDRITILLKGDIQQVATPLEAYRTPANKFVAGFIGSPPMNFLSAILTRQQSGVTVEIGSHRMELSDDRVQEIPTTAFDRKIVLGLRPEAFTIVAATADSSIGRNGFLAGTVDVCENMGSEQLIHLVITETGDRIISRVAPEKVFSLQQDVLVYPDLSKTHFFNGSDGISLTGVNVR